MRWMVEIEVIGVGRTGCCTAALGQRINITTGPHRDPDEVCARIYELCKPYNVKILFVVPDNRDWLSIKANKGWGFEDFYE